MPTINTKIQNPNSQVESVTGFLGGLNSFQDETVIKDSELTKAKNIMLTVDGIEPRYGTLKYGNDGSDSKVYGMLGFYKSDGTRQFLRISGSRLKKLNSGSWSTIGSTPYTAINTDGIEARDKAYWFNGTDNLTSYDGSTVTTFTAITTPVGLAVAPQGTTGSEAYSYRVSAFNAQGETLACTAVAIANGNATLNTTNFNRVTYTAVSGAVGYNIWGRKATGLAETYLDSSYTTTYDDKGQSDPSLTLLPPEGNNTAGIKGKYVCFALQRLFVAGDPANPSRLSYGGTADNISNFSWTTQGGGATDIFKNDGSEIRGIAAFQGGVIIGKDNGVFKFSFDDNGRAKLEEVTRSFGMISHRGIKAVENDLIFPARKDGRLAFYSLGNQENYSAAILRTNELSIKVATNLEDVNLAYLNESAAFYYRNVYGCAIPTEGSTDNDRIWCLDTRFGAWTYWEGITPNCFETYTDTDGSQKLYFGDELSGYVKEMFVTDRNDDGVAISVEFATKSFNQKVFNKVKQFINPTFQFKNVNKSSGIYGEIIIDGNVTNTNFTVQAIDAGGAGAGAMLMGSFLAGTAGGGEPADGVASDQPVELWENFEGRYIKYAFTSNTADLTYKFLSLSHEFSVLEGMYLDQRYRTYS